MTTQAVLHAKDTAVDRSLFVSFELSDKHWQLTFTDRRRAPGRYCVPAGDEAAVQQSLACARAKCGLPADATVHSCYEAGRDGWWLHRLLGTLGVHNVVVDSSSIEVNRRARRAKS